MIYTTLSHSPELQHYILDRTWFMFHVKRWLDYKVCGSQGVNNAWRYISTPCKSS